MAQHQFAAEKLRNFLRAIPIKYFPRVRSRLLAVWLQKVGEYGGTPVWGGGSVILGFPENKVVLLGPCARLPKDIASYHWGAMFCTQ